MDPKPPRPYPLYNTTFTLHRLSPLYTGSSAALDNASLQQYAKSIRETLVGEVLRGVRVGLGSDEDTLARVGALQNVVWQLLPKEDAWDREGDVEEESALLVSASHGILVNIVYEKANYSAILLRSGNREDGDSLMENGSGEFEHFPLLLMRMPGSLKETFTAFLSSTFDTRVSMFNLGKGYLTATLEQYILDCSTEESGEAMDIERTSRILRSIIKDVQIVIGFDLPNGASLKAIDILINKEDFARLATRTSGNERQSPLMAAISNYIKKHLALELGHENVKILKVACGAFVLGSEGKIKITELRDGDDNIQDRATWNLINNLVDLAKGSGMGNGTHG